MASTDLSEKLETEVHVKAAAHDVHYVFCNKTDQISNTSSDKIRSCRLHQGDWGTVGSVVEWSYVQGT
ncbi:hypothetical protein PTKIN_Ptkin14bG0217300 [Pterospermum kingtungense]